MAFFISKVRAILMADLVISILVGVVCLLLKLYTFEAYGTLLTWVGMTILFFACVMGIGGFASRGQDLAAFSLSKAGDPSENLRRVSEARQSSFGCFLQIIFTGISLIAFGNLIQIFASLL